MDALGILKQQRQLLDELLSLAGQVRQALIRSDIARLKRLIAQQDSLRRALAKLEMPAHSDMETKRLGGKYVADNRHAEPKDPVIVLYEEVHLKANALQSAHATNRRLVGHVIDWVDEYFHELGDVVVDVGSYDHSGVRSVLPKSSLLVDHRI